jgi:putative ABC transport system ATP-binding protein
VVVVYSIAIGLLSLVVPVATQSLVNTVAFGTVQQPLVVLVIAVLAALCFSAVLQVLRLVVVEMIQRRVFVRIASEAGSRLLRVRPEAIPGRHGAELVNRFLEVVTVQKAGSLLIIDGLGIVMQTVIGMILLAVYHPYLLVFDASLVLFISFVLFGLGRGAVRSSISESHAKYATVAWLEEVATHGVAFRSEPGASYALNRLDREARHYLNARREHFRILLRQNVGALLLQALASSVLLGVGGWLVIRGELTLGQLIAAELVVGFVVSGFAKFGKHLESFYDLLAAMDKLGYLTDLPLESGGEEILRPRNRGALVRVRGLSYSHSGGRSIFQDLDWVVTEGAKVALHAPSGRGKSTLLELLYGLRRPHVGTIELDGVDTRDLSLTSLRTETCLVRGVEIFPGSVYDNVSLDREEIGLAAVRDALRRTGLLDAVSALPDGLQTPLSSGGLPLSPSQSLRLTIARAIAGSPRVLILDEVLDQIDELEITGPLVRTLFAPDAPWTLIVATERASLWPLCDSVFRLSEGVLVEESVSSEQCGSAGGTR